MDILLSMEQTTAAARLLMPSPMLNKPNYVSMFRIDGVPILPPLMTNEKRKQMKKLKEKAMELEKKLEAQRRKKLTIDSRVEQEAEDGMAPMPYSPPYSEQCPSARSNFSSVSQFSSDVAPPEPDSYLLLSNIMMNSAQQEHREFKDSSTCTLGVADNDADMQLVEKLRQQKARMQKLQKSETLIYDNCSNTIIMPISSQQNVAAHTQNNDYELQQVLEHPNVGYNTHEQQIPVICVNPPTPMMPTRTFCDKLNSSVDSLTGDLVSREASDEPSTDESGNFNSSTHGLKSHKKVTNITAKIIQFETFCDGGSGVLQRLEPPCMKPPLRSATSPSLKPPPHSPNSSKVIHHKTSTVERHSDNPLVRSNSFTLDGPSKALLDHIRQQKIVAAASTHNQHAKRSCYPSASATRDTVESKAKRVQKVELKQRPQVIRNAANSSSLSPYNANSSSAKKQRSPYELKSGVKTKVMRPLKTMTKTTSPSRSSVTPLRQVKPKNSLTTLTPNKLGSNHKKANASNSKILQPELLSEIEAEHRQKFVRLVAQQNEEKMRLQQAFEAQQKLLLEQISVDMDNVQFIKRSTAANPMMSSSREVSPLSGSELSDQAPPHKLSPPLSLSSSSANSYSVVSSTVCDLATSTENPASMETTITSTTTTTMASNRHCTPRRRLFSREQSPTLSATNLSTTAASTANKRREYHLENQRRYEAATKICACARGFLTRRLFQTEQIQRIVQTIRDTLIFVLNLHLESSECPEEANTAANIKLKARLLQQLSSASRTLHLVFFQTTIKERMDIIARDRKRIKTKLLSLNTKRSPRIAT